jgi:hypothetical protein
MHKNPIRRLVLLDGMIFIAAIAIGIAGGRARVAQQRLPTGWWGGDALNGAIWVALAWAVAIILIRLRPPLPRRRLLASQPGFMACIAMALTLAVIVIQAILTDIIHLIFQGRSTTLFTTSAGFFQYLGDRLSSTAVFSIAATWATLAVGRRWRPERSWIEWLGLLLGLYLISYAPLATLMAVIGAG